MSLVRFLVYVEPVGRRRTGRDHVHPPEGQGRRVSASARSSRPTARCATTSSCTSRAFPTADALRAVIVEGRPDYGMQRRGRRHGFAGLGTLSSPRSIARIRGRCGCRCGADPNVLAQALWKVAATRSPRGSWRSSSRSCASTRSPIRTTAARGSARIFPSCSTSRARASRRRRISPRDVERHQRRQISRPLRRRGLSPSSTIPWLDAAHPRARDRSARNIRSVKFLMEGDTPELPLPRRQRTERPRASRIGAVGAAATSSTRRACASGLRNPRRGRSGPMPKTKCSASTATGTRPTRPRSGAGARRIRTISRRAWTGPSSRTRRRTIRRCREARARRPARPRNPASASSSSARGSADPDGDALVYEWFYYPEAGTFTVQSGGSGAPMPIENGDTAKPGSSCPRTTSQAGTMHIILAVRDDGAPRAHALSSRHRYGHAVRIAQYAALTSRIT